MRVLGQSPFKRNVITKLHRAPVQVNTRQINVILLLKLTLDTLILCTPQGESRLFKILISGLVLTNTQVALIIYQVWQYRKRGLVKRLERQDQLTTPQRRPTLKLNQGSERPTSQKEQPGRTWLQIRMLDRVIMTWCNPSQIVSVRWQLRSAEILSMNVALDLVITLRSTATQS